jgi:flagellar basal-body rod protein FlgB
MSGALNTSLNLRQLELGVIGSNIANADTPGYKSKSVEFEAAFREALDVDDRLNVDTNDPKHIRRKPTDPVHPIIYDDPNGVASLDGNTVNRSAEMAKLGQTQLMYDGSVEMLKRKLGMLKYAIGEGGGGGR